MSSHRSSSPRLVLLTLLLGAGTLACATVPRGAAVPATPGEAQTVGILGATYTLPPYLAVDQFEAEPGRVHFRFADSVTACTGYGHFESVGQRELHDSYVSGSLIQPIQRDWSNNDVQVERQEQQTPMLDAEGRLQVFALRKNDDRAATGLLDQHSSQQLLSIYFLYDCEDSALATKQGLTLARVVNSQKLM